MIRKLKQFLFKKKSYEKSDITPPNDVVDVRDEFLVKNRILRMDANRNDIFDQTRCNFHADRYRFACEYTEGKVVLDCASGLGYGASIMKHLGRAKLVYGLELDSEACSYSTEKYGAEKLIFKVGSILDIPFSDDEFDVFTSFETIEHIENEALQLREVKRVLRNKGLYILSTPNDWGSDAINPYHVRHYTYKSLVDTLSKNFEIISIYNQNSGTPNRPENHDCPRSIYKTTKTNHNLAECFIAVCMVNK